MRGLSNGVANGSARPVAAPANGNPQVNGKHNHEGVNAHGNGNAAQMAQRDMPIAICGIALRLPGGVRNDADLLDLLVNKRDTSAVVPPDRFNINSFYDPSGKPGSIITDKAHFIDVDLDQFDSSMFGLSKAEVRQMDPGQRLLLEVTREALESGGEGGTYRGKNIGTFVGSFTQDWDDLHNLDLLRLAPYQVPGKADFMHANRLAFEYNLTGPSLPMKTACSATAQAVNHAVLSIQAGSCPSAIVAGSNLIMAPRPSIEMTMLGVLAPDGSCKTFDASADGYARGESVCALFLKRLDEAVRDGNPIRAVIRACDANADGGDGRRTWGTPNPVTQEALIRQTYASAGLPLSDTKVVECHGTGTPAGDPLELTAIANCFGVEGEKVYVGSIKPNLGHAEGGSIMSSIAKAVVALENRIILPNIKFQHPNPKIPWDRGLEVPTEPLPWPEGCRERMSINSFGLGGANVHLVIDSAASFGLPTLVKQPTPAAPPAGKTLLLLSGNSGASITKMAEQYQDYLTEHPLRRDAMCYTLATRRERLQLASYSIVDGLSLGPVATPAASQATAAGGIAFVFTGQGAQWLGMGRELMREQAVFASSVREMDDMLSSLPHHAPSSWTLARILSHDDASADAGEFNLDATDLSQPVCAALQIALVDLLAAWGMRPVAVVGHSSGEVAAAYAAGILSKREAIITAFYRGYACARNKLAGGMAAIGLGRAVVERHLVPGAVLACENSDSSVTISGDIQPLEQSMAALHAAYPQAFIRRLRVPMAYHSPHMATIADLYASLLSPHLAPQAPKVPYYSTVHGKRIMGDGAVFGPQYWQLNMESPVLFRTALSNLLASAESAAAASVPHLEIGPHAALAGPLRQIYKERAVTTPYVSVMTRGDDSANAFLAAMGQLFCLGVALQMPVPRDSAVLPDLPAYPWAYTENFNSETRVQTSWRFAPHRKHELLGRRVLESSDIEPAWRNYIKLGEVAWLRDHVVGNDIVFPAAGYLAIAGTAVSQLAGATTGYTVRHVQFAAALLLYEPRACEIVTTLRKKSWTSTLDSKWYEFTISSVSNGTWTKHCSGLVTGGCSTVLPPPHIQSYAKKVDARRWYTTMNRIGLNYGPRFVGMQDITASPALQAAALTIKDQLDPSEIYALHPTSLDLILQTWGVAAVKGEARRMDQLSLPTFVEELYVGNGAGKTLRVNSSAHGLPETAVGYAHGVADNQVFFALKGFKATRIVDASAANKIPELKALTLQWHPDADFAQLERYMRATRDVNTENELLERLFVMCAAEAASALPHDCAAQPHLQLYCSWLAEEVQRFACGHVSHVPDSPDIVAMSSEHRRNAIEELARGINGPARPAMDAVWRTYSRLDEILAGKMGLLDVLLEGGLLTDFYDYCNSLSDLQGLYRLLGTNRPQMRVLEIGAGTGGTTSRALAGLRSTEDVRLYEDYTATDVSPAFLAQCRDRLQNHENVKYAVLDITQDPLEQGFESEAYDLIIASNTLHATPHLVSTLRHCRKLLQPDGYMLLQEWSSPGKWYDFIMGLFEGWWLGVEDGRSQRPVICPEEWDERLQEAGFTGVEACAFDNRLPYYNCANMVTRPRIPSLEPRRRRITLLTDSDRLSSFAATTKRVLEDAGLTIDHCIWGQNVPENQDVVSFLDIDAGGSRGPLLANIDEKDLMSFIDLVTNAAESTIVWVTAPAQTRCTSAQYGQILGVARTVRAELATSFATMQLESMDELAARAVKRVLQKIQHSRDVGLDERDVDVDAEYLWRDNEILISRCHPFSVERALAETAHRPDSLALTIGQRGMLQTLQWKPTYFDALGPNEVRIKMTAAGMNFLDVVVAMNIIDTDAIGNALGKEGAGIVTEIGSNVDDFAVGDRVMTMGVDVPIFATQVQRPTSLVMHTPEGLSDADAASMLIVYATVILSLVEKARLRKGQSVLIHSAAGGVGVGAIHVARWLELEIYCTCGSENKAEFLTKEMGIPRARIFASRDDSFVEGVMQATGGKGVDAALNALSGELLHATWQCVAPGGCMLEIGKRDFRGRGQLALQPFELNRAYFGVDLLSLPGIDPQAVPRLLEQIATLYNDGHIHPIHPMTIFPAEKAEDAFRHMQKGDHIGRVILRFPNEEDDILPTTIVVPKPNFKPDREYILVGGLGGLGRSVISWMAANGARHFMVISRSAGTKQSDQEFVQEMNEVGCTLRCYAGSVADLNFLHHTVGVATHPIAGVIQSAMVLRDTGFANMDHKSWIAALTPKVQGTWNLHQVLPSDLDFFVMFGSNSGTLASYGQANYAAANAYLDAFVHFRHALGLPASVLDIAAVGDVGYVANNKDVAERMERTIGRFMSEQEFLVGVQLAMERSSRGYAEPSAKSPGVVYEDCSQIILHNDMSRPLSDAENTMPWRRDPRMAIYRNTEDVQQQQDQQSSEGLRSFIASLASEPELLDQPSTATFFAREILKRVFAFLLKEEPDIDLSLTLSSMGADSLVAIEIRNWWKQTFGTDISVLELGDGGATMEQLGVLAVQRLREKLSVN